MCGAKARLGTTVVACFGVFKFSFAYDERHDDEPLLIENIDDHGANAD